MFDSRAGAQDPPRSADNRDVMATTDEIRRILRDHGRLAVDVDAVRDHDDLYQAGMTSHASVNVMLALEDAFDVEFPDHMIKRSVFERIAAIASALTELDAGMAA